MQSEHKRIGTTNIRHYRVKYGRRVCCVGNLRIKLTKYNYQLSIEDGRL